jgi:hypothetical protein
MAEDGPTLRIEYYTPKPKRYRRTIFVVVAILGIALAALILMFGLFAPSITKMPPTTIKVGVGTTQPSSMRSEGR